MNEAARNLLIEIRVVFPNGSFELSTGYPVQQNLILTARHGLYPKDCPADAPIKVCWFHQQGGLGKPIELSQAGIRWQDEALDAALIDCPFPLGLSDWRHLSPLRPAHGEPWASEGFPMGADTGGVLAAFPIQGTIHGAASTAQRCHLELSPNFKSPDDWGGISGAPVFVRGQIVGFIVSVPTQAEGRLKAVFSADLFKAPGFKEAIGYDQEAGRVAALQRAAAVCLKESELARTYLGQALTTAEIGADALAARIVALPTPESIIETIKNAHAKANADKQFPATAILRNLALTALPARFDSRAVEIIRDKVTDPELPVLKPPLCTKTAVELAMAAADSQPARFKPTMADNENPYPDPEGAYSLDHPPRLGFHEDADDNYFKETWDKHLINKFVRGFERIPDSARLKTAARRLLQISQDQLRTHYVLLEDKENDADNAVAERRAGLIRKDCPSLVFVRLSNDGDYFLSETALLDPFCKLLTDAKESAP